jgi:hypothetical protein
VTAGFFRFSIFIQLFAALAGMPAAAQVLYGVLVGNVTDPQQGAVVGATVSIKNNATNYAVETKTDERGAYEIRNVPPGTYDLKITASGFSTFEAKEINIQANNIARADAPLRVGAVTEVITVGAEIATLQTDKSDIHTDISGKELTNIPIGGYRNFQSVIDLIPGSTPSSFQNASTDSPARALTTNMNGTARNSNNTRIDGAASIFTWLPHHAYYIPPLESIEVVNVSTNNFDAEQGMSGGAAVSVITKSGTNQFRGVAYWYHQNHLWGAKNLFFNPNTPAGPGIPQRIDNQGGGTFGGPIKKDKLFFFSSWERTTTAERGNGLLSVSTAQVRSGNFAGLATVFDPATGDAAGRNRTPFPDNQVPRDRWSPAAIAIQNMLPVPNTGTGQLNNFFASVPYYFKRDMVDVKVNWTPSGKINVFGKYSLMYAPVTSGAPLGEALGGYPGGAAGAAGIGTGNNKTDVFGGGISYVISPTLLFDASFGGTVMHHDTQGPDFGKNIGLDVLRIPGSNGPDPRQSGFPIFNISGYTSLGNTNNWSPVERNDRGYTYTANMSWTRGPHNIRFGFDFVNHQMNHWQPEIGGWSPRGAFNFVNGLTGSNGGPATNNFNAYASFLLGLPGSMGKAYQFYDPMRTREFQQGYYIRDNWQVTRKLSLNLGMRFEHFPIMNRGEFGIERWDPLTNKVLIGGRGSNPRTVGTEAIPVMFGPRLGFAWRMNERTVVRAGFGITNDPYPVSRPLRSPFPAVLVDEYQPANGFVSPQAGGRVLSLTTGIPMARFPDLSSGVVDIPNTFATVSLQPGRYRRGYIESFNFTVERELSAGFVLRTGYVGTRSIRQALTNFEANAGIVPGAGAAGRPFFAQFGVNANRAFHIPMAHQRYDAWQSNVTRRMRRGVFLTSSLTWSKAIGINAGNSDSGLRFYVPSQYSKNRAVADFDRTISWVSAGSWELPFGKGKSYATSGAIAAILGGWTLTPGVAFYTGTPFIVAADGASLSAPQNTQVADQITADVRKLGGVGAGTRFYDPSAFAAITQPRFGNMGLNALRGPRSFGMNAGVYRAFRITERLGLQFRGEALNLTNTPTLNNPNATVTSPANFMQITSTNANAPAPQRVMRFGLRVEY